jgi:hypothetical protein
MRNGSRLGLTRQWENLRAVTVRRLRADAGDCAEMARYGMQLLNLAGVATEIGDRHGTGVR